MEISHCHNIITNWFILILVYYGKKKSQVESLDCRVADFRQCTSRIAFLVVKLKNIHLQICATRRDKVEHKSKNTFDISTNKTQNYTLEKMHSKGIKILLQQKCIKIKNERIGLLEKSYSEIAGHVIFCEKARDVAIRGGNIIEQVSEISHDAQATTMLARCSGCKKKNSPQNK